MPGIESVGALDDYTLEIQIDNGSTIILNAELLLSGVPLRALAAAKDCTHQHDELCGYVEGAAVPTSTTPTAAGWRSNYLQRKKPRQRRAIRRRRFSQLPCRHTCHWRYYHL